MVPPMRVRATASALSSLSPSRPCAVPHAASTVRCFSHSHNRNVSQREMGRAIGRDMARNLKESSSRSAGPTTSMSKMNDDALKEYWHNGNMLVPGTFIPLPLSQCPRNIADLASYQWQRLKYWAVSTVQYLSFKLGSKPTWRARPQWNTKKRQLAPMAKALHREMLEAFAAGDQATLRRICTKQFAAQLGTAISRRNPRESTSFELLAYKSPLFYPRLKSHMLLPGFLPDKDLVLEQAVVAIASTQKASKQDKSTGKIIPGSVKIQDKIEYVVLTRYGSHATYEVEPWRVWGTTTATTLAGWKEYLDVQNKEQAFRSGYKPKA